jgi:chemotaxis protein CheD
MPAPLLAGFENRVVVGIADFAVSNNPNIILTTYSLGSCLGIGVYDPGIRAGGLLHTMLPDSKLDPFKAAKQPGMFVDTGFTALLNALLELNADRKRLKVYVVGGAQIMDGAGFFSIGQKNYQALVAMLAREGLSIYAEHVGGMVNRTMHLNVETGGVSLKISGHAKDTPLCKS